VVAPSIGAFHLLDAVGPPNSSDFHLTQPQETLAFKSNLSFVGQMQAGPGGKTMAAESVKKLFFHYLTPCLDGIIWIRPQVHRENGHWVPR
jgi:hypothetical protein